MGFLAGRADGFQSFSVAKTKPIHLWIGVEDQAHIESAKIAEATTDGLGYSLRQGWSYDHKPVPSLLYQADKNLVGGDSERPPAVNHRPPAHAANVPSAVIRSHAART